MMHQHVETSEERQARLLEEFEDFYVGWRNASEGKPCSPPRGFSEKERKLYERGWAVRRAEMLKAA